MAERKTVSEAERAAMTPGRRAAYDLAQKAEPVPDRATEKLKIKAERALRDKQRDQKREERAKLKSERDKKRAARKSGDRK